MLGTDALSERSAEVEVRSCVLVRDLLQLVRLDYEVRKLRSVRSALVSMGHVARALGDIAAADLEPEHVRDYILQRRRESAAESSIRIEVAFLRRAYRLGVRQRRIHASVVLEDFPQIARDRLKVRRGFLRDEDVQRVCLYLEGVLADVVQFLFASAWRKGEALGLRWDWIDDDAIRLPTSKNGQPRTLALAGEVAEIIERRRERAVGPFVFHRQGEQITCFRAAWRRACERAEVPGRIVHDLRRSAIKRMMEAGANQRDAMSISGHLTVSTFHRYQIVDTRRQAVILESLHPKPEPAQAWKPARRPLLSDWSTGSIHPTQSRRPALAAVDSARRQAPRRGQGRREATASVVPTSWPLC
jgi:integrase